MNTRRDDVDDVGWRWRRLWFKVIMNMRRRLLFNGIVQWDSTVHDEMIMNTPVMNTRRCLLLLFKVMNNLLFKVIYNLLFKVMTLNNE